MSINQGKTQREVELTAAFFKTAAGQCIKDEGVPVHVMEKPKGADFYTAYVHGDVTNCTKMDTGQFRITKYTGA